MFWCASSMLTPYLGLYYKSSGISGAGIGILSSLYAVFFIMGGLIAGMMVDRGIKYKFILYLSVASGFVGAISILIGSKYLFFIPIGLFFVAFCLSAPSPIVDDMLISELHGENHRYSHFRMFGPAGFALGAVIASNVISALDISLIPFLFVAGILVLMIIYRLLPSSSSLKKTKAGGIGYGSLISILKNRGFVLILAALVVWGICEQGMFQYLNLLIDERWDDMGIAGAVSAAAMAGEFIAYAVVAWLMKAGVRSMKLFATGFFLTLIQFLGIKASEHPYQLIPLLFIGGAGFPFLWSTATDIVSIIIPRELTAISRELCSVMISGVGAILGSLIYGFIYSISGLEYAYSISFIYPIVGIALSISINVALRQYR